MADIDSEIQSELNRLQSRMSAAARAMTTAGDVLAQMRETEGKQAKILLMPGLSGIPEKERFQIQSYETAQWLKSKPDFEFLLDAHTKEYVNTEWQHSALAYIPTLVLGGKVTSVADLKNLIGEAPDPALEQWAADWIGKVQQTVVGETQQPVAGGLKYAEVVKPPVTKIITLDSLTIDELTRTLTSSVTPLPPEGMSEEEIKEAFGYKSEEEYKAALAEGVQECIDAAKQRNDELAAFKASSAEFRASIGSLSFGEKLKLAALQPMLSISEVIQPYINTVNAPFAGLMVSTAGYYIPGKQSWEKDFQRQYGSALSEGKNWWMAYGNALETVNWNWGAKLAIQAVFDPINLIGFGFTSSILKPIPFIGKSLAGANDAFIALTDAPFIWAAAKYKALPKLAEQSARLASNDGVRMLRVSVMRDPLGAKLGILGFKKLLAKSMIQIATKARRLYRLVPDSESPGVLFGKYQLLSAPLGADDLAPLLKSLGKKADDFSMQELVDFNYAFERMKFTDTGKGLLLSDETASHIVSNVLKLPDATTEQMQLVRTFLIAQYDLQEKAALAMFSGKSVFKMISRYQSHIRKTILKQYDSPVYRFQYQAGLIGSFMRLTDGFLKLAPVAFIDRYVTLTMARQYLFFMNYGPYNAIESVMRGAFRGYNLLKVVGSADARALLRSGAEDLTNTPAHLLVSGPGREPTGILAAVGQRGETNLPRLIGIEKYLYGITRPLPSSIVIRGKRIPLMDAPGLRRIPRFMRSWRDWNLWFNDIQERMQAYYVLQNYLKQLEKLAPDEMAKLSKSVPDITKRTLASFSKTELQDLQSMIKPMVIRGPESIRGCAGTADEWSAMKTASRIDELRAAHPDIDESLWELMSADAATGKIWKDIDGYITQRLGDMEDLEIAGRLWVSRMYDELAKEMTLNQPQDALGVAQGMRLLQDSCRVIDDNMSSMLSLTTVRLQSISGIARREEFYKTTSGAIFDYMQTVETDVRRIIEQYRNIIAGNEPIIDWSKTKWTKITVEQQDKLKSMLDNLPLAVKLNISEIGINPRLRTLWATYDSLKRRIEFASEEQFDSLYREVSHSLSADKLNNNDFEMFEEFCKLRGEDFSKIKAGTDSLRKAHPDENMFQLIYRTKVGKLTEEEFARDFAKYCTEPSDLGPAKLAFFNKWYPKKASIVRIPEARVAGYNSLLDVWTAQCDNIAEVRGKLHNLYDEVVEGTVGAERKQAWDEFNATRSGIWDKYRADSLPLREAEYRYADSINEVLKPTSIPRVGDELLISHIAMLYQTTPNNLTRGLLRGETTSLTSKEDFILEVRARAGSVASNVGKSADDIGFTEEGIGRCYDRMLSLMGFDPKVASTLSPLYAQMEDIRLGLHKIKQTSGVSQADADVVNDWLEGIAKNLEDLDMFRKAVEPKAAAVTNWTSTREKAMELARKQFEIDFPDYSTANMFDAIGRYIYPFWTYESQRYPWLLRTYIQKPSVLKAQGLYMNYSDTGYVHIPGTDIEISPFRGTIFMGGLRRLFIRDYPEYYDQIPIIPGALDYMSRAGFYPGVHMAIPMVLFGAVSTKPKQIGELLPAWVKTPLDAYLAAHPDSSSARWLTDRLFPERFRDYMVREELEKLGYNGLDILTKKQTGVKLSEEETRAWAEALRQVGIYGILFEQFGLFRLRTTERIEAYKNMAELLAEVTGISPETQEWIRMHYAVTGKDLLYYTGGLDPIDQDMVYQASGMQDYLRMVLPLLPSEEQERIATEVRFWKQIEAYDNQMMTTGIGDLPSYTELDSMLIKHLKGEEGGVTPKEYSRMLGDLRGKRSMMIETLHNSEPYKEVQLGLDERKQAYLEGKGTQPVFTPIAELLWHYYQIKPSWGFDEESGTNRYDWDSYYLETEAMIKCLPDREQQQFIDNLQRNWTPLQKLRWQVFREYIRPYREVRDKVLAEVYTPEEQSLINRYSGANMEERSEIEQIKRADGRLLIAAFSADVRQARRNLRMWMPELDAWLSIWGVTDTLLTSKSEEHYLRLKQQIINLGNVKS